LSRAVPVPGQAVGIVRDIPHAHGGCGGAGGGVLGASPVLLFFLRLWAGEVLRGLPQEPSSPPPSISLIINPEVNGIATRTKDQKCIFFVGPKVHIFLRTKSTYFSPDQKYIIFVGPEVHIIRRTKSAYFSQDQKCIFFAGPEVHIFRGTTSASECAIFFLRVPQVHILYCVTGTTSSSG
jgi:hypothetical protein